MQVSGRKDVYATEISQENVELLCDPCSIDGYQVPTTGFCVDCQHYLCETCYMIHCRPLPMRNHQLLDKSSMPRQKNTKAVKDMSTEKCTKHDGKSIKYFCKSHNQLGCSVCMTTNHRGCDNVDYIAEICKEIEESAEYKKFITKVNKIKEQFDCNKNKSERNISKLKVCFTEVKDDIKKLRKEINNLFDELENEIEKQTKCAQTAKIDKMSTISATCDKAIQDIQTLNSDLELLKKSKQYQQLFIKMKKTQTDIKMMEDNLAEVTKENKSSEYKFVPDEHINNIMRNLKAFGQLKKKPEYLQLKHVQDINIGSSTNCWVTGSTIMSDGHIALVEYKSNSVILVNTKQNKVTLELKLSSLAWDLTETNPGELAVTLYKKNMIQFVSVSDTLSAGRKVNVNGRCFGIVFYMDKLAVTFKEPVKVEIMTMDGIVLKVISTDASGLNLFSKPQYLAISPDKTTLYVSDLNNTVTTLTLEGKVKATYKDKDLISAEGVCVDCDGTIYVCGYKTDNIHQITADGEKLQIPLKQTDGLAQPFSITYSDHDDKLYIGMQDNNFMKVYQLT